MTVRYQSTEEDARTSYYDGIRRAQNLGTTMMRMAIASVLGFLVWKAALPHIDLAPKPISLAILFGGYIALSAAFYGLILGWNWFSRRLIFRHQLKAGYFAKMIGELEVTLGDDGVSEKYPNGSIFTAWSGVVKVERTESSLEIRLDSQYAHLIPLTAFASPDQADAFAAYARERMQAAKAT